jgi:hypothetical protein
MVLVSSLIGIILALFLSGCTGETSEIPRIVPEARVALDHFLDSLESDPEADASLEFVTCTFCPPMGRIIVLSVDNTGDVAFSEASYELQYTLNDEGTTAGDGYTFALDFWSAGNAVLFGPRSCPDLSSKYSINPDASGYIWADLHLPDNEWYSWMNDWDWVEELKLVVYLEGYSDRLDISDCLSDSSARSSDTGPALQPAPVMPTPTSSIRVGANPTPSIVTELECNVSIEVISDSREFQPPPPDTRTVNISVRPDETLEIQMVGDKDDPPLVGTYAADGTFEAAADGLVGGAAQGTFSIEGSLDPPGSFGVNHEAEADFNAEITYFIPPGSEFSSVVVHELSGVCHYQ